MDLNSVREELSSLQSVFMQYMVGKYAYMFNARRNYTNPFLCVLDYFTLHITTKGLRGT